MNRGTIQWGACAAMVALAASEGPLCSEAAGAVTAIYVDPQITESVCGNYDPVARTCGGGTETAYQTIAGAAAVTTPGTTVLLRNAIYREPIAPPRSGAPDQPITFQAYPGEIVSITDPTNRFLDPAIALAGVSNIVVSGIIVTNVQGWLRADGASHNTITNCSFFYAHGAGTRNGLKFVGCHYNRVVNNILDDGWLNLSLIDSDHNLVIGNVFRRGRFALWNIRCGNQNVLRSNAFTSDLKQIGQITDCAGWPSSTPYKANATRRNLVERNSFNFESADGTNSPFAGLQCSGQQTIIRQNRFFRTSGPGLELTLHPNIEVGPAIVTEEALFVMDSRVYNNVFYATQFAGTQLPEPATNGFSGHVFQNNIFYRSIFVAGSGSPTWYIDELDGKPVQILTGRLDGYVFAGNDILGTAPNQPYAITFGIASSTSNPPQQTLAWWQANHPEIFAANLEAAPQFVDEDGDDFRLSPGSPMIDAGQFLARAVAAGSGTKLPVDDAGYFYSGFGIPGEVGDDIRLQGQAQTVRIVDIDYTNHVLTLSQPLTWTAGQGVGLPFSGQAPDVGAFEFREAAQPPRILGQPQSPGAVLGSTAAFSVTVSSSTPVVFQWQKDGTNLLEGGRIVGSTTCCLRLTNLQLADVGSYRVIVANEDGAVTSQAATLAFSPGSNEIVFDLYPTYNLVSIPFNGTEYTNAEQLARGIPGCSIVWVWNSTNQSWLGHPKGGPNNFSLAPGGVYLAAVNAADVFPVSGAWAAPSYALKRGYNFVTLPHAMGSITNAEQLASSIPGCSVVWEWKALTQSWSSHPRGGPNNFPVAVGKPYLIYVSADTTWPAGG